MTTNDNASSRTGVLRPVIEISRAVKTYGEGETAVHALRGIDLHVEQGDYVAVMGASGSGKSTLMNVIGCLDVLTSGLYRLDGIDVSGLAESLTLMVPRWPPAGSGWPVAAAPTAKRMRLMSST